MKFAKRELVVYVGAARKVGQAKFIRPKFPSIHTENLHLILQYLTLLLYSCTYKGKT